MIDGTEELGIPLKFAKRSRDTKNLAISRDFFGVFKTNLSIFRVISFYASWKFSLWLGNSAWDFLGDKFWSSDFLFCFVFLKPKRFFWVLIFASPFDHPCHLKSGVPPLGRVKLKRTLNFSHFPSQVNLYFSDWKLCG